MPDVEQLYLESRVALTAYFLRRHGSTQAAEDLVQETFLRLMRQVDRCLNAASPRGYLFGIARHVSADAWRKMKPELVPPAPTEPDERLAVARETIADMPALQREILDLRFQHDLSYAEIAEALDIPVGTVRSRMHNALAMLRERLETQR